MGKKNSNGSLENFKWNFSIAFETYANIWNVCISVKCNTFSILRPPVLWVWVWVFVRACMGSVIQNKERITFSSTARIRHSSIKFSLVLSPAHFHSATAHNSHTKQPTMYIFCEFIGRTVCYADEWLKNQTLAHKTKAQKKHQVNCNQRNKHKHTQRESRFSVHLKLCIKFTNSLCSNKCDGRRKATQTFL